MTPIRPVVRPGVYRITGPARRTFLGFSTDVDAILNRTRFELRTGSHRHAALQRDWTASGEAAFTFGVLDVLTPGEASPASVLDDLRELLTLWEEKLDLPPHARY